MSVGTVDSWTTGWAIHPRGSSSSLARSSSSSAPLAAGPMTRPLPPDPSTGLVTISSKPAEHLPQGLGLLEPVGVDIGQDRVLVEVVPRELRDVGVDELVVGDAVADRVGQRHAPRADGGDQSCHAEHRVAPEVHRVEEVVVDAPVDDVDALLPVRRAHAHLAAAHDEVTPSTSSTPIIRASSVCSKYALL